MKNTTGNVIVNCLAFLTLIVSVVGLCIVLFSGCGSIEPEQNNQIDSVALIDTAYLAPGNTRISPPCSMSPNYCECMQGRIERIGSSVKFVCDR